MQCRAKSWSKESAAQGRIQKKWRRVVNKELENVTEKNANWYIVKFTECDRTEAE